LPRRFSRRALRSLGVLIAQGHEYARKQRSSSTVALINSMLLKYPQPDDILLTNPHSIYDAFALSGGAFTHGTF
jgi:hypothetical protein